MSRWRQAAARRGAEGRKRARWWHFLLACLLALLSLPVFAGLALVLRLWLGPIDVTDSARRLLAGETAPALSFRRLRLAWNGWGQGPSAPLALLADGVRLRDARYGEGEMAHASAALDLPSLLQGRLTPLSLRASDGDFALAGYGDITHAETNPHPTRPDRLDLGRLGDIDLSRTALRVQAPGGSHPCRAELAELHLHPLFRPAAIGVTGAVSAALSCDGAASLILHGQAREGPEGGIVWHLATDAVTPAALASAHPTLAPLALLRLPVRLDLDAALSGGFGRLMLPRGLVLTARLGAGLLGTPAPGGGEVAVREGLLHLSMTLPDQAGGTMQAVLTDSHLTLAQGSMAPLLRLEGRLSQRGDGLDGQVRARIARFDFAGLGRIWPAGLAPGGRTWITDNVTAGTGHALDVAARLGSRQGWAGLAVTGLSGGVDATGLTLSWLRPIPPLHAVDAHLVLEGLDGLRIEARHGVETVPDGGSIAVGPAVIRLAGFRQPSQLASIDTGLHGGLADMLALLAHPRLNLLSRHPPGFTNPSGSGTAQLSLSIPLLNDVKADDIPVRADIALSHVHLDQLVLGRSLDDAALTLRADHDGLHLQGHGILAGMPATLAYAMDFRSGGPGQVTESAHLSSRLDEAVARREQPGLLPWLSGAAGLDLDYARHRAGDGRVAVALDLADTGIDTPVWRKRAGTPARASGNVGLLDGHLVSLDALQARSDGLLLEGHTELANGHARGLVIDRFELGRSRGAGRIELPPPGSARPTRIALHGPVLDIAPYLSRTAPGGAPESKPAPSWRADLAFGRVLFSPTRSFSGVSLHAEAKGARIDAATLAIDGPTPLTASLTPGAEGPADRRLTLQAADTGALLAALGLGARIEGGDLNLDGRLEDAAGGLRLTALARIGRFTVHDAPVAARLARDLSIYGLVRGAPSRQIVVTRLEAPFIVQGGTLRLTGAHASNDALGATLRGPIDLRQESLDLRGTVVPSYLFNALPGKLPGLGRVFSPEAGGGLLAVTLRITGPIDNPRVGINPLALLAPGILRRLLFD